MVTTATPSSTTAFNEIITFQVGKTQLALPIDTIYEINCSAVLNPVPIDSDYVAGVINLRGEVLTVLDLAYMLSIPTRRMRKIDKYIVIRSAEEKIALAVDYLGEIHAIGADGLEPLPSNFAFSNRDAYLGLVRNGEHLPLVLNPEVVLNLGLNCAVV